MPKTLDPADLARFLVMEGAAELIEAFMGIPEGAMRDSLINIAQVTRDQFLGGMKQPDPLGLIGAADPVKALSGPRRGQARTDDPEVRAVQLMIEGRTPVQAAQETGLDLNSVRAAHKAARMGGVVFPNLKASQKPKGTVTFITKVEELNSQSMAIMSRTAAERGLTLEDYLHRRATALSMAMEGRHVRAIMEATKEAKSVLTSWFASARQAGYDVPYMIDATTVPVEEVAENVVPIRPPKPKATKAKKGKGKKKHPHPPFILTMDQYAIVGGLQRAGLDKAAKHMGVPMDVMLRLRREAIAMLDQGVSTPEVATALKVPETQLAAWRTAAQVTGVLAMAKHDPATLIGARNMGVEPEVYLKLRDEALALLDSGLGASEVAQRLGLERQKVSNWGTFATRERREQYPSIRAKTEPQA